jgi:glutamate racemase
LVKALPGESIIYVSDSAFAPYGNRTRRDIYSRSEAITRYLIAEGCKLIVVACNTATGASITKLRKEFDLPFIGVEPAVKPAAAASRTGHVGVLATAQTFKGEHFKRSIGLYAQTVEVHERVGTGLVELIENGQIDSAETQELLSKFLGPMVTSGIDQLVLGCTHYPFLIPVIQRILPAGIHIIDPAPAVARQTKKVLEAHGGLDTDQAESDFKFYTTGDPEKFGRMLRKLTGSSYPVEQLGGVPLEPTGYSSLYQPA